MYIARDQMKLLEGRLPQKEDEVAVSRYFLSNYGADAGIGEKVMLNSESFHGEYTVTGILEGYKEKRGKWIFHPSFQRSPERMERL
mgnify:FL=1